MLKKIILSICLIFSIPAFSDEFVSEKIMNGHPERVDPLSMYDRASREWNKGEKDNALIWLTLARYRISTIRATSTLKDDQKIVEIMNVMEMSKNFKSNEIEDYGQSNKNKYSEILSFVADWGKNIKWENFKTEIDLLKDIQFEKDKKLLIKN